MLSPLVEEALKRVKSDRTAIGRDRPQSMLLSASVRSKLSHAPRLTDVLRAIYCVDQGAAGDDEPHAVGRPVH